jgi:hypothetical protein
MLRTSIKAILIFSTINCFAQQNTIDAYEKRYAWRIQQEQLFEVYIPMDISDALKELYKRTDSKSKLKFKTLQEDSAAVKLFFSLGRWMSYNWGFYEGSRLSFSLQKSGVNHPDDMAKFLIILFNRSLNNRPLEVPALIKRIQEEAELRKNKRRRTEISTTKN